MTKRELRLLSIDNVEKLLPGTSKIAYVNDFNRRIDTNLQLNAVPYDLDFRQVMLRSPV